MALTRKFLAALGIEQDKIDEIIQQHTESIDGIKTERDTYKKDAEKLVKVQEELDKANETLKDFNKDNTFKVKYDALKEEFDQYKADISSKETRDKKQSAFVEVLKSAGISEKRIPSILKVSKDTIDGIDFSEDGKVKNVEELTNTLKTEWSDFIVTTKETGTNISNPPSNNPNDKKLEDMSMEEYIKARSKK